MKIEIIGATLLLSLVAATPEPPCSCGLEPTPQQQQQQQPLIPFGGMMMMEPMMMPFPLMYMMGGQPMGGFNFGYNQYQPKTMVGTATANIDDEPIEMKVDRETTTTTKDEGSAGQISVVPLETVNTVEKANDESTTTITTTTDTITTGSSPGSEVSIEPVTKVEITDDEAEPEEKPEEKIEITETSTSTDGSVDTSLTGSIHMDHQHHIHVMPTIAIEGSAGSAGGAASANHHHKGGLGGFDMAWMKDHLAELKNFAMKGPKKSAGAELKIDGGDMKLGGDLKIGGDMKVGGDMKIGGSIGSDASIDLSKGKSSTGGFSFGIKNAMNLMPKFDIKASAGSAGAEMKIGDMKIGGSIGTDASIDLSKGKASIGGFDFGLKHAIDLMPKIELKGSAGSAGADMKIGGGDMKIGGSIGSDASIDLSKGKSSTGGFSFGIKNAMNLMPKFDIKASAGSAGAEMKIGGGDMKIGGSIGTDASIDLSKDKSSTGGFSFGIKHAMDLMPKIDLKGSAHIKHTLEKPKILDEDQL